MKRGLNKKIASHLAKKHACYVLITCDGAQADGNMHVEMTYEGDPTLAACLLQGAQTLIDEQVSAQCPLILGRGAQVPSADVTT